MAYKVLSDVLDERTFDEFVEAMAYIESYGFELSQSLLQHGGWVSWYKGVRGLWLRHVAHIVEDGEPYSPLVDEDIESARGELACELALI